MSPTQRRSEREGRQPPHLPRERRQIRIPKQSEKWLMAVHGSLRSGPISRFSQPRAVHNASLILGEPRAPGLDSRRSCSTMKSDGTKAAVR